MSLLVVGAVPVLTALVVLGLATAKGRETISAVREWRLVRRTRIVGVVVGFAAGLALALLGGGSGAGIATVLRYGRGVMLAPAIFGLLVVAAVGLGETIVRPPLRTGLRTVSLRPRRIVDYLPVRTAALAAAVTVGLAATMLLTSATASQDDSDGQWRQLACRSADFGASGGPYPGSFYSVPLAIALLAMFAIAGLAAGQVVRRPRGFGHSDQGDDALRRRSLSVIVAAAGVAVAFSHVGVGLFAAARLLTVGDGSAVDSGAAVGCAPAWWAPVGWVLLVSVIGALAVGVWCLAQLFRDDPAILA